MKVVFDFDGTLCDISHRTKFIEGDTKYYGAFFRACVDDVPIVDVIQCLRSHIRAGDRVEIWSGRSDMVKQESIDWLNKHIGRCWFHEGSEFVWAGKLLTRMRPAKDYQPDDQLKLKWLQDEIARTGRKPDMIYDDRQRVVDMWRANSVTCAQVAPGDFDTRRRAPVATIPTLTVMIGPSGAGKSAWVEQNSDTYFVVSSDQIRKHQFGLDTATPNTQAAYSKAGFDATFGTAHALIKAYLEGGLSVVYDATNLHRRNRVDLLKYLGYITEDEKPASNPRFRVVYVIIDRPLDQKLASYSGSWHTSPDIITKHHYQFESAIKYAIAGDNIAGIQVVAEIE